jgi:hypothetical protein
MYGAHRWLEDEETGVEELQLQVILVAGRCPTFDAMTSN